MIQGKWFAPGADIAEAAAIRRAVLDRGADALDAESWNVLVWQDGQAAATGRLWWRDGAFWLGDVAVLESLRGRRLGDLTLRLLLYKAQSHGARMVRLMAGEAVAPFFARLGFRPDGDASCGIQPMSLPGDQIRLDACAACTRDCPGRAAPGK